ncbi:MAG: hypothetical protein ACFFDN_06520 [Candidatus Hodarchaeota archaeon]
MVTHTFKAKSYEVFLGRKLSSTIGDKKLECFAYIVVIGDDEHELTIKFLHPDSATINNSYDPVTKKATIYILPEHSHQFSWYIDILRNEKPVYVYLSSTHPIGNCLYTGKEPVGEGE